MRNGYNIRNTCRLGGVIMVTARDISDIQALQPDEQVLVLSLVRSFINSRDNKNDAQIKLARMREKYVAKNPMDMEEIDKEIHEG